MPASCSDSDTLDYESTRFYSEADAALFEEKPGANKIP